MVQGLWGKKIGMTQIFTNEKVIPVTAVDLSNWIVTNVKTNERDGYQAVQLGFLRKRYSVDQFAIDWIKTPRRYFSVFKEVKISDAAQEVGVGKSLDVASVFESGSMVDVAGTTKGCGFAGVMKRHNFGGGPKTHGSDFRRIPGSIGAFRSQGRVIKGKRMAGHMGVQRRMLKNLAVVKIMADTNVVFIKGAVPGKAGSLVFVRKVKK